MKVKYSFIVVDLVSSLSISGNVSNINIFIFKNVVQRSCENLAGFSLTFSTILPVSYILIKVTKRLFYLLEDIIINCHLPSVLRCDVQ